MTSLSYVVPVSHCPPGAEVFPNVHPGYPKLPHVAAKIHHLPLSGI